MTVGLLTAADPSLLAEEHRLKLLFLLEQDNAFSVNPHKLVQVDVLILLDTGGINCTTKGFYPHLKIPPNIKGQDQWYEAFRIYCLDWYIKKKIPIVGIGTSALLLYSEALNGKIHYQEGELVPEKDHDKALFESGSGYNFTTPYYVGLLEMPQDMDFYRIVHRLYKQRVSDNNAAIEVAVGVPKTPPPIQATNEKEKPKENLRIIPTL